MLKISNGGKNVANARLHGVILQDDILRFSAFPLFRPSSSYPVVDGFVVRSPSKPHTHVD